MEDLDLYLNRFEQYMLVHNYSEHTTKPYVRMVGKFIEFLNQAGINSIYQLSKEVIVSYQKEQFYRLNKFGRHNTPNSQNQHLNAIKKFCDFLRKEEYIDKDPARDIEQARIPQTLPKTILSQEEIEKLLLQPDIHTPIGYRDRAILELLYSSGIRRQELLNLKPEDLDLEQGFARINQGKGGKDRVVPVGQIACKCLKNYLTFVRSELLQKNQSDYLFISKGTTRLSGTRLGELIRSYAKLAGFTKNITPHVFRHTMATHLMKEKANIRCVQEILGHKSVDTTQRYTHVTITDLKEAHQQCHPREREARQAESDDQKTT